MGIRSEKLCARTSVVDDRAHFVTSHRFKNLLFLRCRRRSSSLNPNDPWRCFILIFSPYCPWSLILRHNSEKRIPIRFTFRWQRRLTINPGPISPQLIPTRTKILDPLDDFGIQTPCESRFSPKNLKHSRNIHHVQPLRRCSDEKKIYIPTNFVWKFCFFFNSKNDPFR